MQRRRADTAAGIQPAALLPGAGEVGQLSAAVPLLSRESVSVGCSQRERLIDAMIDVAATQGYASASVARVCVAAGVSSATFYEQFHDREDCLLAAYRTVATHVLDQTESFGRSRATNGGEWSREARGVLERTLTVLAEDPSGARVLLLEALAGGSRLAAERATLGEALQRRVQTLLDSPPRGAPVLDLPAEALIGALRSIISRQLLHDEDDDLAGLADEMVGWLESYASRGPVRWSTGPHTPLESPQPRATPPVRARSMLPRGRHGVPAAAVMRSQRTRILHATAEVMMRKGYANSTVTQIVSAARISRAVFYAHFTDKQQTLLEAQQASTQHALDACNAVFSTTEVWPTRIWGALRALLGLVAANPTLSHLCLVECYAAGSAAVRNAEETPRLFTGFLQEGYRCRPGARERPGLSSEAITGAIFQMIQRQVARGETDALPRRLPELAYIAIAPFTGPGKAAGMIERLSAPQQP